MRLALSCAAALSVLVALPAAAQIDGFKACSKIGKSEDRLACYDAALAAIDAQAAAELEAQRKAAQLAAQKAQAEEQARKAQEKVAAFGADARAAGKEAETVDTLAAKVAEVRETATGLVVKLDNGQVWRQSESRSMPFVRVGDDVTIRKGILGGYRMTFERVKRTADVKRIR